MNTNNNLQSFLDYLKNSLTNETFVDLHLTGYKGLEENLKKIFIKKVMIKNEIKLSFTYRYQTRDITKNYLVQEGVHLVTGYLTAGFRIATLFTTEEDLHLEFQQSGKVTLKHKQATNQAPASTAHDKQKVRKIDTANKHYLHALNITDENGVVFKKSQDKYRQINHYIEILSGFIKDLPTDQLHKVVDMGSGKGYLTFALYDYLRQNLNLDIAITGVEFRKDMVELCNDIAQQSGFEKLNFTEGTIQDFDSTGTDILIALHACDTATDDAIYKGIKADASLIVVAPCCHKQIRREIEKSKKSNDLDFLLRHGIFMERQAEMATDGIRALILEYYGYKTKVFEFISDAHTPKNVMIVGVKKKISASNQDKILKQIKDSKAYLGIDYHHLERLLEM